MYEDLFPFRLPGTIRVLFDREDGGGSGGEGGETGEGDGGGDGGGQSVKITEDHPEVQKIIHGLKQKNSELIGTQKKLKEQMERYQDLDPDEAREALKKLNEMNDKQLLDEGKIDELLEQRTDRMRKSYDSQLSAKDKALQELNERVENLTGQLNNAVIGSQLADAANKAGVRPTAIPLLRKLADDVWKVEDNKPTAYDSNGDPVMGADTKPLSMEEWVESLRETHDYLFKSGTGGGAGNGADGGGSAGTKRRSEMTPAEKSAYVGKYGLEKFQQLPA